MAQGWNVAVVGATGWLGGEVVEALRLSPLPVGRLLAMASRASAGTTVAWGELEVPVRAVDADALGDADAVFLAAPPERVGELVDDLTGGPLVVDLVGALVDRPDVPVVALGANPGLLDAVREVGAVRSPGPVPLALTAALRPLQARAEVAGIHAVALRPASVRGRGGAEELSEQVVALFNQREPRRVVYPEGLAFDLLPGGGEEGWSAAERADARDLALLTGLDRAGIAISEVIVPIFAGLGVEAELFLPHGLSLDEAAAALAEAPGVELATGRPAGRMVRRHVGSPVVRVGRLREDPAGRSLHVWVATDPSRLAAANAVATAAALLEGRA